MRAGLFHHFARIENTVGIEYRLDTPHELNLLFAHALPQELLLGVANAVFTADLAVEGMGLFIELAHHGGHFFLPFRLGQFIAANVDVQVPITGMAEGTVKSHLSRGKKQLATYLKENGYG